MKKVFQKMENFAILLDFPILQELKYSDNLNLRIQQVPFGQIQIIFDLFSYSHVATRCGPFQKRTHFHFKFHF